MRASYALWFLLAAGVTSAQPQNETPRLPANLMAEVHRLGCAALREGHEGGDVARGHFGRAEITSWAVLCVKGRVTTLLIFPSDSELNPESLSKTFAGDGQHLSIRRIVSVDSTYIVAHCEVPRGLHAMVDHEGISDTLRPVVHYKNGEKWIDLAVVR